MLLRELQINDIIEEEEKPDLVQLGYLVHLVIMQA